MLRIGNYTLKLTKSLFSPDSSCNNISAGRLQRLSNVFADHKNSVLVEKNEFSRDRFAARLTRKNDVYYVQPLEQNSINTYPIKASGVARITSTGSAQRWHQRLGYTGRNFL